MNYREKYEDLKKEKLGMSYGKARYILIRDIKNALINKLEEENKEVEFIHPELFILKNLENVCRQFTDTTRISSITKRINKALKKIDEVREKNLQANNKKTSKNYYDIYNMLSALNYTKCYRCGEELTITDLSIDHIIDWMNAPNPKEMYFDLSNIEFSHLNCNMRAAKITEANNKVRVTGYKGVFRVNKPNGSKFMSNMIYEGKTIHIAQGNDPLKLAILYDKKAISLFGKRAVTNRSLGLLPK
jgi:hypothetical protein